MNLELQKNMINKISVYDEKGMIYKKIEMGEYISLGRIEKVYTYESKEMLTRDIYYATGDLKSRTYYNENDAYFRTEFFDEQLNINKEITVSKITGAKLQVVTYKTCGSKKIINYSEDKIKERILFYNKDNVLIRKLSRNHECEFFTDVRKPVIAMN